MWFFLKFPLQKWSVCRHPFITNRKSNTRKIPKLHNANVGMTSVFSCLQKYSDSREFWISDTDNLQKILESVAYSYHQTPN